MALITLSACHSLQDPGAGLDIAQPPSAEYGSKTSLHRVSARPSRRQALMLCDAYMGFEKNDCLDKVKQDYPQVVASAKSDRDDAL